jgi:hypothetical protein
MKMPLYLCLVEYTYQKYRRAAKQVVLNKKKQKAKSEEVTIGNTLELLNDKRYNTNLMNRLGRKHAGALGCEITINKVTEIATLGKTIDRF